MRTSLVLIFLIMISNTNSLSLKSKLKTKDPIPLKELMHNILKDNVKFNKRETDEAFIYEIWVYNLKAPEHVEEAVDKAVEDLTTELVDDLNENGIENAVENLPEEVVEELPQELKEELTQPEQTKQEEKEEVVAPEEGIQEDENDECVDAELVLDAIASIKDKVAQLENTLNEHDEMVKGFEKEEGKSDEQSESVFDRENKIEKDYLVDVNDIAKSLSDINDKLLSSEGNCDNIQQVLQQTQQSFLEIKKKLH